MIRTFKYAGTSCFFSTMSDFDESASKWRLNIIKWVDLTTLESGDVNMENLTNRGFLDYNIVEGIIGVKVNDSDNNMFEQNWRYAPVALDGETVFNGKSFDELSDSDADELGTICRRQLLENPGTVCSISYWVAGGSSAYLDIDGDGSAEKIAISVDEDELQNYGGGCNYRLNIGDAYIDSFWYNGSNNIYALSPDGKSILLMIYDDGPSADPETVFYGYGISGDNNNGSVYIAGTFEADCRMGRPAQDNGITVPIYRGGQDWHMVDIHIALNYETGMVEEVPQDVYNYSGITTEEYHYELSEELILHTSPGSSETVTIMPQHIKFKQITADRKWFSIEGEDGTTGWIALGEADQGSYSYGILTEAGKYLEEVFSDINPRAG